jgi:DNA-binding CsgD family transcriptional regulator
MVEILTTREQAVLECIAAGKSTKKIAYDLGITFKTAACHRQHVLTKLGASNTADLVCRAARLGLIELNAPQNGTQTVLMPLPLRVARSLEKSRQARKNLAEALQLQQGLRDEAAASRRSLAETIHETTKLRARFSERLREPQSNYQAFVGYGPAAATTSRQRDVFSLDDDATTATIQ